MTPRPPVFVILGQIAAGKSTVAKAMLDRFPLGYHIDVDGVREMVTSGLASPLDWTPETTRQFELAIRASAALALVYANAGFAVAIEGAIDPDLVAQALREVSLGDRMVGVVLRPRLDVALARNRHRSTKAFDTSVLEPVMRELDAELGRAALRDGWRLIDNSDEPVAVTVDRILAAPDAKRRSPGG